MKSLTATLTMRIGGKTYPVADLQTASREYEIARDMWFNNGGGTSGMPKVTIQRDGKPYARISQNGRVWSVADDALLYDCTTDADRPIVKWDDEAGKLIVTTVSACAA